MKIQPSSVGDEFSFFGQVHLLWCDELLSGGDVEVEVLDSVEHFTVINGEVRSSGVNPLELATSQHPLSRGDSFGHVHEDIVPVVGAGLEERLLHPVEIPAFISGACIYLFLGSFEPHLVVRIYVTGFFHSTGIHDQLDHLSTEHLPVGLFHGHVLFTKFLISNQVLSTVFHAQVEVSVLGSVRVRLPDANIHSTGLPVVGQFHVLGQDVGILLHVSLEGSHVVVEKSTSLGVFHAA